jgi:hypothetical protein
LRIIFLSNILSAFSSVTVKVHEITRTYISDLHTRYSSPHHTPNLLSLLCLHRLSGNGFQSCRLLSFLAGCLLARTHFTWNFTAYTALKTFNHNCYIASTPSCSRATLWASTLKYFCWQTYDVPES